MLLDILDQNNKTIEIEYLFHQHIDDFKKKFFRLYTDEKKILLAYHEDMNETCKSFFQYLCRTNNIFNIYIILDGKEKSITLAYDEHNINSDSNIIFHGDELSILKQIFQYYDKIINNFNINTQQDEYIIVQSNIIHNTNKLHFSTKIKNILCWLRKYKTNYEIYCIWKANIIAKQSHEYLAKLFFENNTLNETELYFQYLWHIKQDAIDMPYKPIIALNNASSILHYKTLVNCTQKTHSFLIDAGYKYYNYCSDITNTYSKDNFWCTLIHEMTKIQKQIVSNIRIYHQMHHIHTYARKLITDLLIKYQFIKNKHNIDNFHQFVIQKQIDRIFFPHSIGHLLGLEVHDVGSNLILHNNHIVKSDTTRETVNSYILENNMVFTIEPGIYINTKFIDRMKYDFFDYLNFDLLNKLQKFGGIRIETNILIYNNKIYDLTKKLLEKY